ncbi:MAG: RNA methyltransferase [Clostridium sp.]|nr:RNA methyltransferase [Prevotella sp.]MCM1429276.1 RNA methyltransferase [Clostridium sp.]MCM1475691.1 RNA methyltransferase [Muribaculaceae bacterium]
MEIAELSKTKGSLYSRLKTTKMRRKEALFTVEGTKCVADTIRHFELEALVATTDWIDSHTEFVSEFKSRVFSTSQQTLDKISTLTTPPKVIAIYRMPAPARISFLLQPDIYLMLDGIQDPGNLGTIIRTAHWFGVKKIFASPETVSPFNPKTIQASMGSIAAVDVIFCNLSQLAMDNPEIPVYCLDLDGENLFCSQLPTSAFIVMGNEGHGVSETLRLLASRSFLIPPVNPSDHPDSLNVAIATSITLSQFTNNNGKINN